MNHSIFLPDEAATVAFGKTLANACHGRGFLNLSGDLGTGKTTLSRGLVQAHGHTGAVKSPTYTIVEPYDFGNIRIFHFDLYRLEDPEELEFIGLWDYLDQEALIIVEWPERAAGVLPAPDVEIDFSVKDTGRLLAINSGSDRGQQILSAL
jgi:tRNA threonylcarbamoyladenosine biosynthesis protein TsaE